MRHVWAREGKCGNFTNCKLSIAKRRPRDRRGLLKIIFFVFRTFLLAALRTSVNKQFLCRCRAPFAPCWRFWIFRLINRAHCAKLSAKWSWSHEKLLTSLSAIANLENFLKSPACAAVLCCVNFPRLPHEFLSWARSCLMRNKRRSKERREEKHRNKKVHGLRFHCTLCAAAKNAW